ncbi:ABC transporter ATP-binding protein [Jannaschia aquimarina]|uniref:Spermidine/putrescine import ATP-binding protein PotA n=1 Tax=Jannaschia aquimarina TaxID=935700 RepID=A0A0D1CKB3_9RHOB|nr:ABC transporter ATP-binding protein [Jannaschia aquimarina]KIT15187.1 Spermidine/putrescine import ATP-binding protein PotA [Jannaschia aquimarina]SNS85635.1 putrescine transport system ATP-binding protein [Jannaschia aquimarina]
MSHTEVFAPWDDPEATPLISCQDVTKRYGEFTAIERLTLDIFPREFFALLGPSGCGKTTLMRMLGGFEDVSGGRITIDGQDMAGIPPNKRAVNMMFQSYALFPHLTVWDNLAFGLKRSDMAKDQIGDRVEAMLKLVQLQKFAKRKPHQLSGGQKQRVALARALAKGPKLLLLDEPLGALDKKLRQQTQFELMDIQEKTGTTFVIVTHDQEEAMTVASRIAVMDEGRIVQVDTPGRIYEAPNSVYVADFIGDVNVIRGRVSALNGESAELNWGEGKRPIRATAGAGAVHDASGAFVIRPEKVTIATEEPTDRHNRVKGVVEDIAYLGNLSTFHVRLESGDLISAQLANSRRFANRGITWEDPVWLSWSDTAGLVLGD